MLHTHLPPHLGAAFRRLAQRIEEGPLMKAHVPILIAIPPKHPVSRVIGFIKVKRAVRVAVVYGERKRNLAG